MFGFVSNNNIFFLTNFLLGSNAILRSFTYHLVYPINYYCKFNFYILTGIICQLVNILNPLKYTILQVEILF